MKMKIPPGFSPGMESPPKLLEYIPRISRRDSCQDIIVWARSREIPPGKENPARIPAEIPLRDNFLSGSRRDFCWEIYFLPGSRRDAGILPGSRRERKISPGFLPGCHCLGKIPGGPAGKGKSRRDSRREIGRASCRERV